CSSGDCPANSATYTIKIRTLRVLLRFKLAASLRHIFLALWMGPEKLIQYLWRSHPPEGTVFDFGIVPSELASGVDSDGSPSFVEVATETGDANVPIHTGDNADLLISELGDGS